MSRRAYLYFAATIVLGAILGGSGLYYVLWHSGRLHPPGGFNKQRALAHLRKDLSLTDDQIQQVSQIFDESTQKVRALQKQIDPQFEAIHQETRARIRQILTPEQAQKFDALIRAIDERHKRHASAPPHAR